MEGSGIEKELIKHDALYDFKEVAKDRGRAKIGWRRRAPCFRDGDNM